jgi:probable F420-dependent oxidoreductase
VRLGVALPHIGTIASAEAVVTVARRAEELGYDSAWTLDRLLWPLAPRAPYPATGDGHLPDEFRRVMDPIGTLIYVAAHTNRIALGTSVLDIPWYSPVMLARQVATLDVVSGGRARVGLGLGWSPDEMEATGGDMRRGGKRADEFLTALKAVWTTNPVEFEGEFYRIAKSYIDLKPVQKPHPPIYLAAYVPPALNRIARLADGWNAAGIPAEPMGQMFGSIRQMAQEAGRDPASLELVVRANCYISPQADPSPERFIFTGSLEQLAEDTRACQAAGATEVFFELGFTGITSVDAMARTMETLKRLVA